VLLHRFLAGENYYDRIIKMSTSDLNVKAIIFDWGRTLFDEIVEKLNLPRRQILIVDDRTIRGIKYGSRQGHPTVWFQNGKFANELPDDTTGSPTFTIHSLTELLKIL